MKNRRSGQSNSGSSFNLGDEPIPTRYYPDRRAGGVSRRQHDLHQEREAAWNRARLRDALYEHDIPEEKGLADVDDTAELKMRLRALALRNGVEPDEEMIDMIVDSLQTEAERTSNDDETRGP